MARLSTQCLKAALSALHYSGASRAVRAMAPLGGGQGAIFMLHHVKPRTERQLFDPNGLLTITPRFLEAVIVHVRRAGFEIVTLDAARQRLVAAREHPTGRRAARQSRPFACFTFDDGYRDNRDVALPIMQRHEVPFTVYVATEFADGRGFLWWLVLERIVRRQSSIEVEIDGRSRQFRCATVRDKRAVFDELYWRLRKLPEAEARGLVLAMAHTSGIDAFGPCRELVMNWDELRRFAAEPLVTIGAHSVRHMALGQLPEGEVRREIADSVARIEKELGRPCRHFCFPYGNAASAGEREFGIAAELGLATAVTTRKGLAGVGAGERLTGMTRVSLNGNFQRIGYVDALLSGLPFALWNTLGGARRGSPAASGPGGIVPPPRAPVGRPF